LALLSDNGIFIGPLTLDCLPEVRAPRPTADKEKIGEISGIWESAARFDSNEAPRKPN
jgi:hypothetical protein